MYGIDHRSRSGNIDGNPATERNAAERQIGPGLCGAGPTFTLRP
jgi:hypothetical protein